MGTLYTAQQESSFAVTLDIKTGQLNTCIERIDNKEPSARNLVRFSNLR